MARDPKKGKKKNKSQVWRPGVDELAEDEELEFDSSAYDCLHAFRLEWPCLSCSIIPDELGPDRKTWPHSMLMVAGTQASTPQANSLAIMRFTSLSKTYKPPAMGDEEEEEDEEESDSDMEEEEGKPNLGGRKAGKPVMHLRQIQHPGGVNRVRCCVQNPAIVASWSDNSNVLVWSLTEQVQSLLGETAEAVGGASSTRVAKVAPLATCTEHKDEGFALDWSPVQDNGKLKLLSGDCKGEIHLQESSGAAMAGMTRFKGHASSVEDVQWSPVEATVFASCGVDQTVRIWDTRRGANPVLTVKAHDADVNVISWSRLTAAHLASGCDDGSFRVWDLRGFKEGGFIAGFTYHKSPITSIEWSPHEAPAIVTSSADNQVAVWDLSVERDTEEEAEAMAASETAVAAPPDELPAQLMFVHQGQNDVKEAHWHPQIPGMLASTAGDGFNIFRPNNL
eukprot:gene7419-8832_t